jgi:hypothetical protein
MKKRSDAAMLGKIILWISAISFIGYGLACFYSPELPAGNAGLTMGNADAVAEIRAMYGGLQTGFGLFCLLAALKSDYYRAGLLLLVLCITPLALGRLYSTVSGDEGHGGYTWAATAFEFAIAALAAIALASSSRNQAAQ